MIRPPRNVRHNFDKPKSALFPFGFSWSVPQSAMKQSISADYLDPVLQHRGEGLHATSRS